MVYPDLLGGWVDGLKWSSAWKWSVSVITNVLTLLYGKFHHLYLNVTLYVLSYLNSTISIQQEFEIIQYFIINNQNCSILSEYVWLRFVGLCRSADMHGSCVLLCQTCARCVGMLCNFFPESGKYEVQTALQNWTDVWEGWLWELLGAQAPWKLGSFFIVYDLVSCTCNDF